MNTLDHIIQCTTEENLIFEPNIEVDTKITVPLQM